MEGEIVSSQTVTSKSRTVETTTYAIEQEGKTETHIEQKVSCHRTVGRNRHSPAKTHSYKLNEQLQSHGWLGKRNL